MEKQLRLEQRQEKLQEIKSGNATSQQSFGSRAQQDKDNEAILNDCLRNSQLISPGNFPSRNLSRQKVLGSLAKILHDPEEGWSADNSEILESREPGPSGSRI